MTVRRNLMGMKMTLEEIAARLKTARDSGELLQAIDYAQQAADLTTDPDLKTRMRIDEVIMLARAASHTEAEDKYHAYGLDKLDHPDAKSLRARLLKDLGLTAEGDARTDHLTASRRLYLEICQSNDPDWNRTAYEYNGVNAVTLSYFLGDMRPAEALAQQLEAFQPQPSYYSWATRAEVLMVRGAPAGEVREALEQAVSFTPGDDAKLTTLTQLSNINPNHPALSVLRPRPVLHYSGHMISAPDEVEGRILAKHEATLAARINDAIDAIEPSLVVGSLASGADILIVEKALRMGVRAEVFIPFHDRDFHRESIQSAGANWALRARACLDNKLCTDVYMTRDHYIPDLGEAFAACSRRAMGAAILTAKRIRADARQLVVWDGVTTQGSAGADADRRLWASAVLGASTVRGNIKPSKVIDVSDLGGPPKQRQASERPKEKRRLAALVFGDAKNFSKLSEGQLPTFVDRVLGGMATALNAVPKADRLFSNTWGDGIFAVFTTASAAADFAQNLQAEMKSLRDEMTADGYEGPTLPAELKIRLGMHYGVVFEKKDPVTGTTNYFGEAVARAARIEPITKEGRTFVSEEFAAELALDPNATATADYVGEMDAAKNYGRFRLYRIRPRSNHM